MTSVREMNPDELRDEAIRLLGVISAEFESDPMSVQCFDLRIVQQTRDVCNEHRRRRDNSLF